MRRYETIFIVRPNAGEDDITGVTDKVSSIITANSGTVVRVDKWGLRKLAYLISKESQGYYVYVNYGATPAAVVEIERILKIDDRILKFMTVKIADTFDPDAIAAEEEMAAMAEETAEEEEASDEDESDNENESDDEDE